MSNRDSAIQVIKRLRSEGFEALLAGGCVRDRLLGRMAKDYDVATNAEPADVTRLFRRALTVGAQFGVVMVLIKDQRVEVATFRSDAEYRDGRRPSRVVFTTARQDAARRDFTINGMFYDPIEQKVIDYVGGQEDLQQGVIRTIGDPKERFNEDYLRMLRAVRFSAQLNFTVHPDTLAAIKRYADNIQQTSGERICMELEGILCAPGRVHGVALLEVTGLAGVVFPLITKADLKAALVVLTRLRKTVSFALGLAALCVNLETQSALDALGILKLSRRQRRHVQYLLEHRGRLLESDMSLAQLKLIAGNPYFRDLYELQRAIQRAGQKSVAPLVTLKKRIKALGNIDLRPKPLLNGYELIRLGARSGPMVGQLSEELYIAQLEGTIKTKSEAKQWVRQWLEDRRQKTED